VTGRGVGESATTREYSGQSMNYAAVAKLRSSSSARTTNYSVFSPQLKRQALDNISARLPHSGCEARRFSVRRDGSFTGLSARRSLPPGLGKARLSSRPTLIAGAGITT